MADAEQRVAFRARADRWETRELDESIAQVIGWTKDEYKGCVGWRNPAGLQCSAYYLPRYTASLDAAMSLVPPEHEWSVDCSNNSRALVESVHWGPLNEGLAATPALALTAACLRAIASLSSREKECG